MNGRRLVYMIGFMGSGKTTAGKKLASKLKWKFIDLDQVIEKKEGLSIPEIFGQSGEEYFRKSESEMLRNLENLKNAVVSKGGGAPCHYNNMDFMLKTGITIYLKMTPEQLSSRLKGSNAQRPLIKDLEDEKLLGYIGQKLSDREKWYGKADIIVNGYDVDINELCLQVRTLL
jgi:shikimate kinase